jgi:hypothetical protein
MPGTGGTTRSASVTLKYVTHVDERLPRIIRSIVSNNARAASGRRQRVTLDGADHHAAARAASWTSLARRGAGAAGR